MAAGGRPLERATIVSIAASRSAEERAETNLRIDPAVVDHLRRDPQDDRQTDIRNPPVALDIFGDGVGGDAHQRDGSDEAHDQDAGMLTRRAGDREDVIEAHADVGQCNGPCG